MTHGSQQLRLFRRARRDGATIADAAAVAGFSMHEAEAWAKDDDENPPPPEAYLLLGEKVEVPVATRSTSILRATTKRRASIIWRSP